MAYNPGIHGKAVSGIYDTLVQLWRNLRSQRYGLRTQPHDNLAASMHARVSPICIASHHPRLYSSIIRSRKLPDPPLASISGLPDETTRPPYPRCRDKRQSFAKIRRRVVPGHSDFMCVLRTTYAIVRRSKTSGILHVHVAADMTF